MMLNDKNRKFQLGKFIHSILVVLWSLTFSACSTLDNIAQLHGKGRKSPEQIVIVRPVMRGDTPWNTGYDTRIIRCDQESLHNTNTIDVGCAFLPGEHKILISDHGSISGVACDFEGGKTYLVNKSGQITDENNKEIDCSAQ